MILGAAIIGVFRFGLIRCKNARCCEQIGVFNAMMLIRFVFSAHRLGFLMLLRFVALYWVPIRFVFECYSD